MWRYIRITENNKLFTLETKNTSYIFYIDELGLLQHIYYGAKIDVSGDALQQKYPNPNGCSTVLSDGSRTGDFRYWQHAGA